MTATGADAAGTARAAAFAGAAVAAAGLTRIGACETAGAGDFITRSLLAVLTATGAALGLLRLVAVRTAVDDDDDDFAAVDLLATVVLRAAAAFLMAKKSLSPVLVPTPSSRSGSASSYRQTCART